MFASLKNKIKEETGNEVPVLTIRSNSTTSSRYSRGTESIASTSSSIDELSIIEQKDAEIQALRFQLNDVTTKYSDAEKRNDTLEDLKIQLENDNQLLEESIKVAQSQKDIICEEQDKIQNLQAQEISKLKSLLLFREQEALDRLSILKQTQHQVENHKHELARVKKYEPMLEEIQDEFEQFRHESQLEKNNLLSTLAAVKEENRFLKSRLEIYEDSTVNFLQNLPIDEKIETLLNERKLLQQRLEEAHIHLQDVKSTWSGQNLTLETQLSRLSRQVAEETSEKRKIEQNYDLALDKLKQFEDDILLLENQVIERNNKIKILEDEIEDLSTTLKAVRLENDDEIKYLQSKVEENNKRKSELTTRLSVSDMKLNELMENAEKHSKNLKDELYSFEEQVKNLNNLLEKEKLEKRNMMVTNAELSQNEELCKMELLRKRDEMNDLNDRINLLLDEQTEKESKLNELYSELDNLKQLNKLYHDKMNEYDKIENDLMDKTKTIKILNQRLVDMKKTLQKELKTNCNGSTNNNNNNNNNNNLINNLNNSNNINSNDNNICDKDVYKLCSSNHSTNGSKIVMDEVNFKYLKHVVFKFLTSREVEARHLIRAVSTLLHLSTDEEKLLHDTLNWKMSWFGSKPDHGTGQLAISIPPGF